MRGNSLHVVAQSLVKVLNFMLKVIRSFRKRVDDMELWRYVTNFAS